MRSLGLTFAVAALAIGTTPGRAQQHPTLPDRTLGAIDAAVSREMAEQHIPGLALGIVRHGRLMHTRTYGLANVELDVPVSDTTVFKIGSVSKQFIAAGILALVQDGKIGLDDPIGRHVPNTPPSWSRITIRHLMTHTSGLVREGPAFDPFKPLPDSVVIASAFERPLEFPTGTKWQYCNVCYFALADIVRRVSGKPWPEFMRDRVFLPAGMTRTRTTTTTELVPGRAAGYTWREGAQAPAAEFLAVRPSGAFLSTIGDLAKWDSVLSRSSFFSKEILDATWTPMKLENGAMASPAPGRNAGYGFGWMIDDVDGHRRAQHGGSLPGFRAQMSRYLDAGLTVIVLTNATQAQPDRIETAIARIILAGEPPRP